MYSGVELEGERTHKQGIPRVGVGVSKREDHAEGLRIVAPSLAVGWRRRKGMAIGAVFGLVVGVGRDGMCDEE